MGVDATYTPLCRLLVFFGGTGGAWRHFYAHTALASVEKTDCVVS